MNNLWIGIGVLSLIALFFIFLPLVRAKRAQEKPVIAEDRKQQNIDIFKERLAELSRERDNGVLDDAAFSVLKLELEKNLLGDVVEAEATRDVAVGGRQLVTVALLALITVTTAMGLYSTLGSYEALEVAQQRVDMRKDGRTPTIEEAITSLQDELRVRPDNPEGWYMLATTYLNMGRYAEGAQALTKVLGTLSRDAPQYPGVMGQYAQAKYFALGNTIDAELRRHIDRTLQVAPGEITTLGLLGIDAFEQQRYQQALDYWNKALAGATGEASASLTAGIEKARQALAAQGITVDSTVVVPAARLNVQVSLSDELKARVRPDQVVFVFARPVGGRMPLAAVRLTAADLPAAVVLDDSLAMMPESRLSSADTVEVNAKVSMSGQPGATAGDLFGSLSPIRVKAENGTLKLVIDQVVQ